MLSHWLPLEFSTGGSRKIQVAFWMAGFPVDGKGPLGGIRLVALWRAVWVWVEIWSRPFFSSVIFMGEC